MPFGEGTADRGSSLSRTSALYNGGGLSLGVPELHQLPALLFGGPYTKVASHAMGATSSPLRGTDSAPPRRCYWVAPPQNWLQSREGQGRRPKTGLTSELVLFLAARLFFTIRCRSDGA